MAVVFVGRGIAFFLTGLAVGVGLNRWLEKLGYRRYRFVPPGNGILYGILFTAVGYSMETVLTCGLVSVLLILSIVDWETMEILPLFQKILFGYGLVHFIWKLSLWRHWLAGSLIVSLPLALAFFLSRGNAVGGGDVKLMALCGFYVGAYRILFAFFLACLLSCLHQIIKKIRTKKTPGIHQAYAMGPYLSIGVFVSILL